MLNLKKIMGELRTVNGFMKTLPNNITWDKETKSIKITLTYNNNKGDIGIAERTYKLINNKQLGYQLLGTFFGKPTHEHRSSLEQTIHRVITSSTKLQDLMCDSNPTKVIQDELNHTLSLINKEVYLIYAALNYYGDASDDPIGSDKYKSIHYSMDRHSEFTNTTNGWHIHYGVEKVTATNERV